MVQSIVEKLKLRCNTSSTKNNYYSIWKTFNQFIIKLDCKPDCWEDRLVLLIGYLIDKKRKSTTIRSYILAIKAVLKDDDIELNINTSLLNSLTRACHLQNDKVQTRLPIRKGLLSLLLTQAHIQFETQPYLLTLFKVMLVAGYYGLLRVGEMTASPHVLKSKDVKLGKNKNKLMFVLHSSKTH